MVTTRWMQCSEWLKKVIRMGKNAPEKGWQRAEQEWGDERNKHQKTFQELLCLKEYEPHNLFWQYLKEVRQLGIEKKEKEAHARDETEKAEYLKNIHDTIYACKTIKTCKELGNHPLHRCQHK